MHEIRHIVVPTDFSPLADSAAARAASLARLDGAAVHVVHAVTIPLLVDPYSYSMPTDLADDLRRAARDPLEQTRKAIEARGVATVTAQIADSPNPVAAIADAVRAHDADLVVMGTHGRRGLEHAFLGSVTERTIRTLDRPVLAVKEDAAAAAKPIAKIVLAVDFSAHSDRAVAAASHLAQRLSASIDVIHVFSAATGYDAYLSPAAAEIHRQIESEILERLDALRARLEQHPIRVTTHFRRGNPETTISALAREIACQLIVMGTRGRTGLAHVMLGSVAERTLRTAPCSVLCVKATDADARSAVS